MRTSTLILLSLLGAATVTAQNYKPSFSTGKLPDTMTAVDADGLAFPSTCYKKGMSSAAWSVGSVGSAGSCAISPSHSHQQGEQNNRLTIKQLTIESGAIFSWQARSVYPDFADTYRIEAKVDGASTPDIIFEGTAEAIFTPHAVTLEKYAGKKVEFTIVCTSENGFLLAVNNIFIGVPTDPSLFITEKTLRFAGKSETINVFGDLSNSGKSTVLDRIVLKVDGKDVASKNVKQIIPSGETVGFSIDLPVEFNKKTSYTLQFLAEDGSVLASKTGAAMSSWFPRTHLIDEGTGTWCNNCPEGTVALRNYMRDYPGQMSFVTDHANDAITNDEYWTGLRFFAVPYFMLNHIEETKFSSPVNFEKGLWEPTPFQIKVKTEKVGLSVEVTSGEDIDNSRDRYRLGYIVSADVHVSENMAEFTQKNSVTSPNYDEYYYLPTLIATDLAKFHNVNVGGDGYFNGLPSSLPTSLIAYEPAQAPVRLYPPTEFDPEMWANPMAHVYIIDTQNNHILNTASIRLDGTQDEALSEVNEIEKATSLGLRISERDVTLEGAQTAVFEVYSIDGSLIFQAAGEYRITLPETVTGTVIIRAITEEGTASLKAIL